jgi:hypothetical protein
MNKKQKFFMQLMAVFCLAAAGVLWYMEYVGFAIFYIVLAILDFMLSLRKKPFSFGIQQPNNPQEKSDEKKE